MVRSSEPQNENKELFSADNPRGKAVKWCSVPLSDVILNRNRLDASVFDIETKQVRNCIMDGKYGFVYFGGENGIIEDACYPGRFKRVYCKKGNGEAFYLPSQMLDIYPKTDKYISKSTKCNMDELRLKQNTLLLTRSGTIGNISLVSKTMEGKVFSDDVIRITFKQECDLGYMYAFFKTKAGKMMLTTNGYGSVITHLEPEHLAAIPVPDAPIRLRQKINGLITQSYSLRDESNKIIDMATAYLAKELQLPDIEAFDVSLYHPEASVETYSVKLSDMEGRFDASYHAPIVPAITEHLKEFSKEVAMVGDSRISKEIILPGRFKRVYVEEGYGIPFFGGKNIGELDPSDKKYLSFSRHGKKIKDELTIREGMILITCSGTVGNIALVPKHWDGWAMTHDIIRLVPCDGIAGYVYIWLQTVYANAMLKACSYGSVVSHIEKEHLCHIPVPMLKDKNAQMQINNLALQANRKRYEAYELERQAIEVMEREALCEEGRKEDGGGKDEGKTSASWRG